MIFILNYPPLSLKSQKTSNNAGEGGRESWPVHHIVFFRHRRGGLHDFDWASVARRTAQ